MFPSTNVAGGHLFQTLPEMTSHDVTPAADSDIKAKRRRRRRLRYDVRARTADEEVQVKQDVDQQLDLCGPQQTTSFFHTDVAKVQLTHVTRSVAALTLQNNYGLLAMGQRRRGVGIMSSEVRTTLKHPRRLFCGSFRSAVYKSELVNSSYS